MNRREFIQCAAVLAAGLSQAPLGWSLNAEQNRFIASRQSYINRVKPTLFSSSQRASITAMAETILPRSDTPGAIDCGVPTFIEAMVQDWFTDEERQEFLSSLDSLNHKLGGFDSLTTEQQRQALEELEEQASDSDWYQLGNVLRAWMPDAPFVCHLKELSVLGYMLSEKIQKEVLETNPMGSFDGEVKIKNNEKPYATSMVFRQTHDRVKLRND